MQIFLQDPSTSEIPRLAFRDLQIFNINVGKLNFVTPSRLDAAIEFFRGLNLNKILNDVTRSSFKPAVPMAGSDESDNSTSDPAPDSLTPPLTVKINNVYSGPRAMLTTNESVDWSKCTKLWVDVVDPTSRLEAFRHELRQLSIDAGFLDVPKRSQKLYKSYKILDLESPALRTNPQDYPRMQMARESLKTIDAKFKNYEWTKDFQLEKLSIIRYDRRPSNDWDPSLGGFCHVLSLPLPEAKEDDDISQKAEVQPGFKFADLVTERSEL